MTYQIIYSSESAKPMLSDDLEDILQHARSSNASKNMTGALVYVDGLFLQIHEGDAAAVQSLMARIASDVRHEAVTALKAVEIPSRIFSDWNMAYVSATQEQIAQWAGLCATAETPQVLAGLRQDPLKVAQVVQSILSVLLPEPAAQALAD